ncbi:hypothetical protein EMCRGX_G014354 [Ephydatia muelleri]
MSAASKPCVHSCASSPDVTSRSIKCLINIPSLTRNWSIRQGPEVGRHPARWSGFRIAQRSFVRGVRNAHLCHQMIPDMVSIFADPVRATDPFFQLLTDHTSVPVDQIRYIFLLSMGYPLGAIYRHGLAPSPTHIMSRHMVSTSIGLLFGLMCFGWVQMGVLFSVTGVCYAMLLLVPSKVVHIYTIVFAMASMSAAHIYRMMVDYGGWHLDFTGPLMLIVQRVTLTAFALHDGVARKEAQLNEDQKLMKLTEVPSLLEYWSYNYNFHTFLAGPTCTLKEYLNFVDGSNFKATPTQNGDGKSKEKPEVEPPVLYAVITTLLKSLLCLVIHLVLVTRYPMDSILAPDLSLLSRMQAVYLAGVHTRMRYYFIWLLTESINNYIGLGFSGYKEGKPVWDVCKNVHLLDAEFGTNFRAVINGWNVTTSLWLRRVCYDRVPPSFVISPTMTVWLVSAMWHGFYPSYYLTFVCCGFITEAARKMRRLLNHHFQTDPVRKRLYDVATVATTLFFTDFAAICFQLLFLHKCLRLWSYFYYAPFVVVVLISVIPIPGDHKIARKSTKQSKARSQVA